MSLADNQAALCYLWLFSNMINLTYYKAGDFLFQDKTTKPWIVAAITKIAAQIGYLPENIKEIIINQLKTSNDVEMNQVNGFSTITFISDLFI